MKSFLIIGNWKLNKTCKEAINYVESFKKSLRVKKVQCGLAVPFTALGALSDALKGSDILLGAQSVSDQSQGAYTGEVSAEMVKELGSSFTLIGHSERRHIYSESSKLIQEKVRRAIDEGLMPVLCLGETAQQREQHQTKQVLKDQLFSAIDGLTKDECKQIILAYEPVWAIGTGHAATAEHAQEIHKNIRDFLAEKWGEELSSLVKILYGGSVKNENILQFLSLNDINGALVGGASLNAESFADMVNLVEENET